MLVILMLKIVVTTVAEFAAEPNFQELLDEYAKELVVEGAPKFGAKMEMYYTLEAANALSVFVAYLDGVAIGFVTVLTSIFPHCGVLMATTESLFVLKQHRKTGAGLKLIRAAEGHAKERGSPCLFISAPFGGNLAEVLPHIGYIETNRVFFRKLTNV